MRAYIWEINSGFARDKFMLIPSVYFNWCPEASCTCGRLSISILIGNFFLQFSRNIMEIEERYE